MYILTVTLVVVVLAGCQSSDRGPASTQVTPVPPEPSRYLVDEGMPPVAGIIKYLPVGQDSALTVDFEGGVYLFIDDRRAGMLGRRGRGPCEYEEVTSLSVVGDTVFIFDRRLTRILGYSIGTGECEAEVSHPDLIRVGKFGRVGGWYYVLHSSVTSWLPEDYVLLHRLDDEGTLEPLELTVGDLQAHFFSQGVQLRSWRGEIQEHEGGLYFTIPLSHRVWRYDIQSGEAESFEIVHSSLDLADYGDVDPSEQPEMFEKLEMKLDPFLFDDHLSLRSYKNGTWYLGLYTYEGDLIAKDSVADFIRFTEGGSYYALVGTDSETEIYEIRRVIPPVEL